jgi:pilus assembly protein CpaD
MSRLHALGLAAAAVALGACAQTSRDLAYASRAHTEIRPVQVTAELRLTPDAEPGRLDLEGREAVRNFAAAYREEGDGPLLIQRPRGSADEGPALRLAGEIRGLLLAEGVNPGDIRDAAYDANGGGPAATLLAYSAWEAQVEGCPTINMVDLTETRSNTVAPSFGCAVSHNLAMMIADPRDLEGEQTFDAPDPIRRTAIMSKYRAGTPTGATKSGDGKVSISSAVGN